MLMCGRLRDTHHDVKSSVLQNTRDLLIAYQPFPPNTHSAQVYSLRFGGLPGPRLLCVYYDISGNEVFRLPPLPEWMIDDEKWQALGLQD